MCGICGIIRFDNKPAQEPLIRGMMVKMKHRGPDDEGIFIEENISFGFVRLSIIDLSPAGHQPMISSDNRFVIVFNGEIFNYIELRDELITIGYKFKTETDTEVLLNAYIEWGKECLNKFNGMWAFVIYDRHEKKVFCSRDRFGIKPFYYLQTSDYFAFTSEIPPLLTLLMKKPTPDYQSIFDFLVFNRTDQTEHTFFKEIKKLQHGCNFTINKQRFTFENWYNLKERVKKVDGFRNSSEFRDLFSSAVGLRLRSDVPVGVCLSGGLDSSSIVSVLLKDYKKLDLNTFSAIYQKGQIGYESNYISEFKPVLNNMFFTSPSAETFRADLSGFIRAHAEPIPSTSPYAQYKVMELAKGKVVVTLDGQGADEELAGYHYFFGFFFKDLLRSWRLSKLFKEMIYYIKNHRSIYGFKTFLYFLLPKSLKTDLRLNEKRYLDMSFVQKYKKSNSVAGSLYSSESLNDALIDHFEYKLEHLLKWEDRNSMWFSIEARVPFLDYRLVEKTLATSGDLIIKDGTTKHLLRASMNGILPEKIRKRKDKMGFDTPEDEWFREPKWQALVTEVLNSRSFTERGIIDPQKARKMHHKHVTGTINASKEIWKWIHLELWFREFID